MVFKRTSTVSATEARVHFGQILRRVEGNETIVVERSGEPKVVIMSIEDFERLSEAGETKVATSDDVPEWRRKLERANKMLSRDLAGRKIDWVTVINDMREDRSLHLLETLEKSTSTTDDTPHGDTND